MLGSWQPTTFIQWSFVSVIAIVLHQWWFRLGSGKLRATQNFVPSSTPPTTKFKRKALLIGIDSEFFEETLESGGGLIHRDTLDMRRLLIDTYHYDPLDVTILINNNNPEQMQPTQDNIIQKINDLIEGARQGDRFFFYYSGITIQVTSDDAGEDGLDESIVTSDERRIRDKELIQLLAKPLPIGSTLVTVFDCCHAGSLLDLKHSLCNRVYVPWVNKGVRQPELPRNIMVQRNTYSDSSTIQTSASESTDWFGAPDSSVLRCESPESIFCDGQCHKTGILQHEVELDADIICLSSAKKDQISWLNITGQIMTQTLIKTLKENPSPSLQDLLTAVSYGIHHQYLDLHAAGQGYKQAIKKINIRRLKKKKAPLKGRFIEMDNFQEPEISSTLPLDMSRRWLL